jgi:Fe-S-cluster-containing hydrogenase component 2
VGAIDFAHRGSRATISTAFDIPLAESPCVGCGQCAVACPTGAIIVRDDTHRVWEMIDDPETFVTCEIAPAVRVGIGRELGLNISENAVGLIVAALHRMGFDEVYDTSTGADLTVIEEANEFVERVQKGEKIPLFTSCCPAWVQFVEKKYPEFLPNLSTARSPMSMFAAVVKEIYKDKLPEGKKMQKGDVFNVYRVEYVTDERGRLSIDERKYGCEFDGRSIETSLLALDEHINENDYLRRRLVPGPTGPWQPMKPLEVFLFDRHWFTEQQADYTDRDLACTLADAPKGKRHVWRYSLDCQTFAADMKRGAIDLSLFHVRTM